MTADDVASQYRAKVVVCAASGPSLTVADLELVRESGLPLVVCNSTWQLAPWADVLVAMDTAWWKHYGEVVAKEGPRQRVGFTQHAAKYGATATTFGSILPNFGNSGACAIALMARGRAKKVLLIGYDASADGGRLHWHPDHPKPLANPQKSLNNWPRQFDRVAAFARKQGTKVVNCSRKTSLTCFERMELEEALRTSGASTSSTSVTSGGVLPVTQPSGSAIAPGP